MRYGVPVSLGKRFLATRAARSLIGTLVRAYRTIAYAGFLIRHDAAFLRLLRSREPAIFVCWHQDFVHTLGVLSRRHPGRRTHVLASASRDGGLAAAAAEAVGFARAVRGSSAAGGATALRSLVRLGRSGRALSFAVVADGPRPPARDLKPGAIHLARETGLPVWCLRTSWHPDPSLRRTWAQFHAPRPFHRGIALADGPFHVPKDADGDAVEALRRDLESRLSSLADRADAAARSAWG